MNILSRPFILLSLAILLILALGIVTQRCQNTPCINQHPTQKLCQGIDTIFMKNDSTSQLVPLIIRCNEVILNPGIQGADNLRDYLKRLCFKKKDSCNCGPNIELWVNPDVNGIDVGVVVAGAPRTGGVGLGLFPNVVFSLPEPLDSVVKDSIMNHEDMGIPCLTSEVPPVPIAIVDSGVDPTPNPSLNSLNSMNWQGYNHPDRCIRNTYPNGIEYLSGLANSSPIDSNGHGTSVNAVLVGASLPNFQMKIPLNFVNVDVMTGHTKSGTLYDALCGLYYALEQDPKIINISWGFRCLDGGDNKHIFAAIKNAFDQFLNEAKGIEIGVLIVAGAGNDSIQLESNDYFFPASLACCHDNLISVGSIQNNVAPELSEFSNYSKLNDDYVSVMAPGEDIIAAYPMYLQHMAGYSSPSGFARVSGTSFAAPYISRVAAMIRAMHKGMTAAEVKNKLLYLTKLESSKLRKHIDFRVIDYSDFGNKLCDRTVAPM